MNMPRRSIICQAWPCSRTPSQHTTIDGPGRALGAFGMWDWGRRIADGGRWIVCVGERGQLTECARAPHNLNP